MSKSEEATTIPKSRLQIATEFWCALRRISGTATTRMTLRVPRGEFFAWAVDEQDFGRYSARATHLGKDPVPAWIEVYMPGGVLRVEIDK